MARLVFFLGSLSMPEEGVRVEKRCVRRKLAGEELEEKEGRLGGAVLKGTGS
jgi:hypothetical protein